MQAPVGWLLNLVDKAFEPTPTETVNLFTVQLISTFLVQLIGRNCGEFDCGSGNLVETIAAEALPPGRAACGMTHESRQPLSKFETDFSEEYGHDVLLGMSRRQQYCCIRRALALSNRCDHCDAFPGSRARRATTRGRRLRNEGCLCSSTPPPTIALIASGGGERL